MASPSAKRPDATKVNSTGAVVLLDLENVIGSNPPPEAVDKCLSDVLELAAPVAVCWAAYPQRLLSERAREVLKRHGVKTQWAKAGNNSADRALLKLARKEADKGRRRFVIVSGDADFAPLADLGSLEVIARHEQKIGSRLRRRASRIHRLPGPDSAACRAPASAVWSAEPAAEQRPGDVQRLPIPRTPGQVAVAGLALWAAGTCFGAGMATGAWVARRVLRA